MSFVLALATLTLATPAFAFDGSQVVTGGGTVDFTGVSSTNWVKNAKGGLDFLLVYSNATDAASFTLPGMTSMRLLAVGGGGGGGGIFRNGGVSPYGGGGGGGAGGLLEQAGRYTAATYNITVGKGGEGGSNGTSAAGEFPAQPGDDTLITTNGVELMRAYGGGGGGGQCAGGAGGSGGGGSQKRNPSATSQGIPQAAGEPKDITQGRAGGAGDAAIFGGGGGGAGAPGAAASTGNPVGGDGRPSDIAVDAGTPEANWPWYAGGGGGSDISKTPTGATVGIAGGKGGGGQGGCRRSPAEGGKAKSGVDGTGGGGGGASANGGGVQAGSGGCGAVIVRIEAALDGPLAKPTDSQVEYDGQPHSVVPDTPFYTIEGENTGVAVSNYTVRVTPVEGVAWTDGTRDTVTVMMTIYEQGSLSGTVDVTGAPVSFYGASATNWVKNADGKYDFLLVFSNNASFKLPGSTSARVLAVGGGGGGGGIFRNGGVSPYGGGGGGGAGGMLERTSVFSAATYAVTVGKGGEGGSNGTSAAGEFAGDPGGDSLLATNGVELLRAYGGGGGGGQCAGGAGGSGGGGSQKRNPSATSQGIPQDGGLGTAGQGRDGGAGDKEIFGGGGGGAGAPGAAASTGNPVGGDGRPSDITLDYGTPEANWPWYAGGGGGSDISKTPTGATVGIAGGKGGGGQGGCRRSPAEGGKAKSGVDGTGGGGGGASANGGGVLSGSGGSGIVIVRISSTMQGEFKKPDTSYEFVYDATEHSSVRPNVFYDVTGEYAGTTAGVYRAHVKLHDGVVWPEGGNEELDVTMTIKRLPVEITSLAIDDWTFHDETLPEVQCAWVTDPVTSHDLVKLVYEYQAAAEDGGSTGSEWSDRKPTHAGEYWLRARSVETNNFDCAEKTVAFTVKRLKVTFSNLQQLGWMAGTPVEDTPNPSCDVEPSWVAKVYEYEVEDEGGVKSWTTTKPTTAGEHKVRVRCLNDTDYEYESLETTFLIINGLGGFYRDYVEITIGNYRNTPTLTNFPLVVSISETSPVGFLYSRAGTTGEDLSFTDASGDVMLPYELVEWNTNGVSQFYVRIPELANKSQVIRLYWNVREGVNPPSHMADEVWSDWTKEDAEKVRYKPQATYKSPVSRDGKFVDYWTKEPAMSATFWDTYDALAKRGVVTQKAELKYNTPVCYVTNLVTGACWESPADDFPATLVGGIYRLVYELRDESGAYEPTECHVDFTIHGHSPWDDLRGHAKSLTLSGRVLLANNDVAAGYEVTDQGYWQTREVITNATTGATLTNDVYWVHGTEEHSTYASDKTITHMMPGTTHKLCYVADGVDDDGVPTLVEKTLWRFQDVVIGNTARDDGVIRGTQSMLPWSTTGLGISSYENRNLQGEMNEAGNLLLRNLETAIVWSPCYTNGLGTLYFDAVNSDTNQGSDPFHLVVEVATTDSCGFEPTDENAKDESRTDIGGDLGKITNDAWERKTIRPFFYDGTSFAPQTWTDEVALANTVGRSTNRFYRLVVPINVRGPVRFRIRRVTMNPAMGEDNGSLIHLDNLVVSYPLMGADIVTHGVYDKDRALDRTLGWENAMIPPFPALTDKEIYGRGQAVTYVNETTNANPKGFIQRSTMYYRWRYLDQASNDWQTVELQPGDDFVATKPLVLPRREGDVEYWFESLIDVPYYAYHDYSGTGAGLDKSLYTEDRSVVTNRLSATKNWFFRYRPGRLARDAEGYRLYVRTAENSKTNVIEMTVHKDGVLRGYVQTLEPVAGKGLYVRFEEFNRQTAGSAGFATNSTFYAFRDDVVDLSEPATLEEVDSNTWSRVVCDAKTGYLLFQVTEGTRAAMVVHADRQNFNAWSDANRADRRFVGTSTYTNDTEGTLAGVSARVREFPGDLDRWHLSTATNALWTEHFKVEASDMNPGGPWAAYEPFSEKLSPNRLNVGPGQWIAGNYRDFGSGMALQMEGCGKGYIQFVDAAESPRGLESIALNVRLAQPVEFGEFAYRGGDVMGLTNYTFFCRAAYDVAKRTSFAGNASLSLVACYRAGEGAYELRVEQENANFVGEKVTGPGNTQRLTLYRWNYDDETGEVQAHELGHTTYNNASMLTTDGEKGKYALLFISAKNTGTATEISAGVSTGCANVDDVNSTTCRWLGYIDDSVDRIANGTYGVMSANCPARFRCLHYSLTAQACPTTTKNKIYTGDRSFTFPNTSQRVPCSDDLANGGWVNAMRRMVKTDLTDPAYFGLKAKDVTQSVKVYVGKAGSATFTEDMVLTNIVVSNFGAIDPVVIPLYTTQDCSVKVAAGGTAKSMRNDVALDDLEFRQWRGESYDDKEGAKYFDDLGYGSPTNFVFTYAWIKPGADGNVATNCEFNAKRVRSGEPISIRTPLFDDGGDESRGTKRGLGLGMFSFTYANAQTNVNLLLQIATNNVSIAGLASLSKSLNEYDWKTVTNWSFTAETPDLAAGVRSCYLGLHGVKGVMRLVMDPKVTAAVADVTDETAFGKIDITGVLCRDEPNIDKSSWWGWNVQTTDEADKRNLWDETPTGLGQGLSFALNNSVDDRILDEDKSLYPRHLPFLQTPTFAENVVGEVTFRARKYAAGGPAARVTLFGASNGASEDSEWTKVTSWDVTNDLYETYSYRTKAGQSYAAFRFAVTGIEGMDDPSKQMQDKEPLVPAQRVLIDDAVVLEAIRARVTFRDVAAFRGHLDTNLAIANVTDRSMQPLCNEAFSVQAELFAAQLADEVDLSTAKIELWWYVGDSPWGFDQWQTHPQAKHAPLAECAGTNLVFRGNYLTASDAVIPEEEKFTAVQYMLVATYRNADGTEGEAYLSEADWQNPFWYSPVDYNASKGGTDEHGKYRHFSAYTLLDTVASGWAWINEANLFSAYDNHGYNLDKALQFVEIAAPAAADLSKWKLVFLDGVNGSKKVITNEVATFGVGRLKGKKDGKFMDPDSKCVFHVVASPLAESSFSKDEGQIDGTWSVKETCTALASTGEVLSYYPVGIQLVRPSGIVEHEIVATGTNRYAHLEQYDPDRKVDFLKSTGCANIFSVGQDNGGVPAGNVWSTSLGAMANKGWPSSVFETNWSSDQLMTPGRKNAGETIEGEPPEPLGSSIRIYALVEGDHVWQTFGDAVRTNDPVTIIFKKGSEKGTNITYDVDRWYVPVTTNGTPVKTAERDRYVLEVGKGLSNNVTVVAKAVPDPTLDRWLAADDRYRMAVVDWLSKGRTMRGAFANPDFTEPGVGDFYDVGGNLVTKLDLTTMYWLDMDPSYPDGVMSLRGGILMAPGGGIFERKIVERPAGSGHLYTNRILRVMLAVTNTASGAAWSPYVLRDATPGVTSWDYAKPEAKWGWTNVSFKVTGIMMNDGDGGLGGLGLADRENFKPLRYFVFNGQMIGSTPYSLSFDNTYHQSKIEISDPYQTVPIWRQWLEKHPTPDPENDWPIYHRWDLDNRIQPVTIEVMKTDNPL